MTSAQPSSEVAERIRRIEQNLSPANTFRNLVKRRSTLAERMAYLNVPGASIAVINNHQIEWAKGYGVLQAGQPELVNTATLFQCASISKPVAAVTALRLVEAGQLDLDEDVNEKLISWKVPPTAFQSANSSGTWQPRLTVRQLLSHTAGLTVHGFPGYAPDEEIPTLLQVLDGTPPANSPAIRVDALPGLQYRYSGGGYCVLQQLLIDVTGKRYPDLVRELVLDLVGMHDSTSEQPLPANLLKNATAGHHNSAKPVVGLRHIYPEIAAAGLWSTPSDLARFALALQAAKAGVPNALLSQQTMQQMFTKQAPERKGESCGLGIFLQGEGKTPRFEHSGGNEGFICLLQAYQNLGIGAVVMTNSDTGWHLVPEIMQAIAEEYAWPDYQPPEPEAIIVQPQVQESYVGKYEVKENFHFTITQQDGQLFLHTVVQDAIQLFAQSETDYFMEAINAKVTFSKEQNGQVTALRFKQNGREISAKKTQ